MSPREMMPTNRFFSSTTGKLLSRVSTINCSTRVSGVEEWTVATLIALAGSALPI
jgi:hypothetical protein